MPSKLTVQTVSGKLMRDTTLQYIKTLTIERQIVIFLPSDQIGYIPTFWEYGFQRWNVLKMNWNSAGTQ